MKTGITMRLMQRGHLSTPNAAELHLVQINLIAPPVLLVVRDEVHSGHQSVLVSTGK